MGVGVGPGTVEAGVCGGAGEAGGCSRERQPALDESQKKFFLPLLPLTTVTAPAVSV